MKAIIIYDSKTGITKGYAEEIGKFLSEKGIDNRVFSIDNYDEGFLKTANMVLLGAWTQGLFLFAQHPGKKWKKFAKNIPEIKNKNVLLFTTYKLLTGSMFKRMKSTIIDKVDDCRIFIKSRNSRLTEFNRQQLENWINQIG